LPAASAALLLLVGTLSFWGPRVGVMQCGELGRYL